MYTLTRLWHADHSDPDEVRTARDAELMEVVEAYKLDEKVGASGTAKVVSKV